MYDYPNPADAAREQKLKSRLQAIRVTCEKRLSAAGSRYIAPSTIAELALALAECPDAALLAGGTDLGLRVTKDLVHLPEIVYLGNVAELGHIALGDQHLEIGAGVSLTDAFEVLTAEFPDLREMSRRFASPPVCNAGTLGGNIANGSPIGDTMPALISLGAAVVLQSATGARSLPLEDFYLGYMKKDLRQGEFVAAVRVPRARPGQIVRCYKIAKRYEQDISAVCGAFSIEVDGRRLKSARVCFGGMAATPQRARACEQALIGADLSGAGVEPAVAALLTDFQPITDFRASQAYRQRVAGNLVRKLVAEALRSSNSLSVWGHAG
jgi:xanthine dehydrogenase small subunit